MSTLAPSIAVGQLSFQHIKEKLSDLNIKLPEAPVAAGLYKTVLIHDRMASFSGHLPIRQRLPDHLLEKIAVSSSRLPTATKLLRKRL